MTYTQKETLKMALAFYEEHCKQMRCFLKNKKTQEYYKKELDYIWDAIAAVDALEEDP